MKCECNICNCYTLDQQSYLLKVGIPLEGMPHFETCGQHKEWMLDRYLISTGRKRNSSNRKLYKKYLAEAILYWTRVIDWRLDANSIH